MDQLVEQVRHFPRVQEQLYNLNGGTLHGASRKRLEIPEEGRFNEICLEVAKDITDLYLSHALDSEQCPLPGCKNTGCTREHSVGLSKRLFQFKLGYLYPRSSPLAVAGEVETKLHFMTHTTILLINITTKISQKADLRIHGLDEGIIFRTYTAVLHSRRARQDGPSVNDWYSTYENSTTSVQLSQIQASTLIFTVDGQQLSHPDHTAVAPFSSLVNSALTAPPIHGEQAQEVTSSLAFFQQDLCTLPCCSRVISTERVTITSRTLGD
jgi:hypothetical protein